MKSNKKLIICLGPVCSGKTTWSKEYVKENKDTVRFSIDEFLYMCTGDGRVNESLLAAMPSIIGGLLMRSSIVVDGFPLNIANLKHLMNYRYNYNSEVIIRLFDVRFDEAVKRSILRARKEGRSVKVPEMRAYMTLYKEFISSRGFQETTAIADEVICDEFTDANRFLIS